MRKNKILDSSKDVFICNYCGPRYRNQFTKRQLKKKSLPICWDCQLKNGLLSGMGNLQDKYATSLDSDEINIVKVPICSNDDNNTDTRCNACLSNSISSESLLGVKPYESDSESFELPLKNLKISNYDPYDYTSEEDEY